MSGLVASSFPRCSLTAAAKADSRKQASYRSGEPLHPITPKAGVLGTPALRHPKSSATPTFSAG